MKYLLTYISPSIILFSLYLGGYWVFMPVLYVFGLVPFLELFFNGTNKNMTELEESIALENRFYDLIIWSMVPFQYVILFFFLNKIGDDSLLGWEKIGMTTGLGVTCGALGINAAHELGHRNTWYEQLMSKMLLLTSLYMHFFIEHNRGHHKNVSTDEDPASSKYGETVYAFFFRSVKDSWLSAWNLEQKRLSKAALPFWSLHNEMLMYQIIQVVFVGSIAAIWGLETMLYFMGAAVIGFLLLETVNYIEHYGLRRKKVGDGFYEKVLPVHSWNSNHPLGRVLLLELTRHSDHHFNASRKYQILRHFDNSPQMPAGYPAMMLLSLIPPLWFNVMHKEIEKYQ